MISKKTKTGNFSKNLAELVMSYDADKSSKPWCYTGR